MATLNGTIGPPPAGWDPYAPPGGGSSSLLGQDPYLSPGQFQLSPMFNQVYRLLKDVSLDYHWFSGHGSNPKQLGINDVDLAASFNVPMPYSPQTPVIVTPGFAFHFWDGPKSVAPAFADMPPQTFDAFLNARWTPKLNELLKAELEVQTGVYSDFRQLNGDSLRVTGKGMFVLSYSPGIQVKGGVWYLDREQVKLLPAGGIVWTPDPFNQDTRFEILFPNPSFHQRLRTINNTEWWWYVSGDYGGDTWTIKRTEGPAAGAVDLVDYNDIRVAVGLEFKRLNSGLTGLFEAGGAFDRELAYRSLSPATFRPQSAFFLRAGVVF
jgi:hypothetical protein